MADATMDNTTRDMVERVVSRPQWLPYHGFHDEHRGKERTQDYKPAVQQVREEFYVLAYGYWFRQWRHPKILQLGIGPCPASHFLWMVFGDVLSIDMAGCRHNFGSLPGYDTHSQLAVDLARAHAPYDLLFIDAGHRYYDVERDYEDYRDLVKPGGVIAFHDALERPGYGGEIEVPEFLHTLPGEVHMIGTEVGTAWIRKS